MGEYTSAPVEHSLPELIGVIEIKGLEGGKQNVLTVYSKDL